MVAVNNTPTMDKDYIVFLDTEQGVIDALRPVLEKEGYEPLAAADPEDALHLCQKYRPKVLLPDISKPDTSRHLLNFIKKYKEANGENIGIVLLSKNSVPECEELKGIRYVREPYLSDDLVCAIREAEDIVLLKDERDMFLEQLTDYAKGLAKMVEEQTMELTIANKSLKRLSVTDDLTGIYNRRYFFDRLGQEINQTRRYEHPLSVMILDLDNFKSVNDCMGHQAGDDVLREFATLLKGKLRNGETAARYGGEEFAVILPHVSGSDALKAAEVVRKTVESAEFSCSQAGIRIRVSIGVAELDEGLRDPDEIIARADLALYEAKRQGKNKVSKWPPDKEENSKP
jgi:diguanylate cyclase (GGDEF)-like protein